MNILKTNGWEDYELIDSGNGYRLERFGKFILSRPDPQIIWQKKMSSEIWEKADAIFQKETNDKGKWIKKNLQMPDKWQISYKNLKFWAKLTPFKHTGIFPEQHLQWDFIESEINSQLYSNDNQGKTQIERLPNQQINKLHILNLFAYTGISSLIMASAGAKVTHLDASKPSLAWARENQEASNLNDKPIRLILDDATKFAQREIKRGVKYDGIIMDPPVFGHGPTGEIWKFNESFPNLLSLTKELLSSNLLFIIINAYAISSSCLMLKNVMNDYFGDLGGEIKVGELVLEEKENKRELSTGIYGRWSHSKNLSPTILI